MGNDRVELRYKKWMRIIFYTLVPLFLALSVYMFQAFLFGSQEQGLPFWIDLFFIVVSILAIVSCLAGIPHVYKMRITIDEEGITKEGIFDKYIGYDEIERIKVAKGLVEVAGKGRMNIIAMGNLYEHFEPAVELLAMHTKNYSDISFEGKAKYIQQYFDND